MEIVLSLGESLTVTLEEVLSVSVSGMWGLLWEVQLKSQMPGDLLEPLRGDSECNPNPTADAEN